MPERAGEIVSREPVWSDSWQREYASKSALNIAATAIVAAKVYDAFQWVHWHGRRDDMDGEYHVCTAEEIMPILTQLAIKALTADDGEATQAHGELRFLAWATDDDDGDRSVDFYLSIGSSFLDALDRPEVLHA